MDYLNGTPLNQHKLDWSFKISLLKAYCFLNQIRGQQISNQEISPSGRLIRISNIHILYRIHNRLRKKELYIPH